MSDEERAQEQHEARTSLVGWLVRLKRHEDRIFIRVQRPDGMWENKALSEATPEQWADAVSGWIEDGILPVYVREDVDLLE